MELGLGRRPILVEAFPHGAPSIMENVRLGLRSRQIPRHRDPAQKLLGVDAAGGALVAGVYGDFKAEFGCEDGLGCEAVEIGLTKVEGGGSGGVVEGLGVGREAGDDGVLRREVEDVELDLAEA
ncbi:hypothetical protein COP2_044494 [Malus domestica]